MSAITKKNNLKSFTICTYLFFYFNAEIAMGSDVYGIVIVPDKLDLLGGLFSFPTNVKMGGQNSIQIRYQFDTSKISS